MSMTNTPSDLQRTADTANASHPASVFSLLLIREARLLIRRPAELANPLVFFAIVIALFPLAVGPQTELLKTLSPGLLWVAALLAVLLSLDGLFRSDFEDGSLEQWVLSSHPLPLLALTKVLAHWLFSGLALVLLAPLLALMLGLPARCLPVLLLSLLLGTPVLSLLGAVGAALTVGLKRGGLLLALLILPLYIPVLILGSGALQADLQGLPTFGHLLWMASLTALTVTLSPFAIAAGLSISVGE